MNIIMLAAVTTVMADLAVLGWLAVVTKNKK
jgi:hypothetical protein